jgi:hypothetical protein
MAFKQYAKKQLKRGGRAAKGRYFKGKGYQKPKLGQMFKDVQKLKHLLNVEKKVLTIEERTPIDMGLIVHSDKTSSSIEGEAIYAQRDNVMRNGGYINDNIIGTMTQGTANGQIVGERAKIVSYHMDYRVKAIEGTSSSVGWGKAKTKVRLFLVMMPRGDQVLTDDFSTTNRQETLLQRFFEPSVFDDTYDGTRRNIEFMKDFKVLSSKVITFNHDETNDSVATGERYDGIVEGKMGGKCDHHIRYNGSNLIKNQLALIAIPDAGEVRATGSHVNRFTLEYSMKMYYVDN